MQFSLPCHGHNICLLNPLSWGHRDNSLKALNLANQSCPPSAWQCSTIHKHQDKGGNHLIRVDNFTASSILTRFSNFTLSSLRPHERRFKRQAICQWWDYENCSDEVVQRTVNKILWNKDSCSHSKGEHLEKWWLLRNRDVIHRGTALFWSMIHVPVSVLITVLKKKKKKKSMTFLFSLISLILRTLWEQVWPYINQRQANTHFIYGGKDITNNARLKNLYCLLCILTNSLESLKLKTVWFLNCVLLRHFCHHKFWNLRCVYMRNVQKVSRLFFVLALLLIVHTWNSSPLRSNLLWLQCTCCTILTTSQRPHGSPLVWAYQWPSSQPLFISSIVS